ncbi:MAG: hypothetical protein AAB724_03120 [Patescibacteria group bacterium]
MNLSVNEASAEKNVAQPRCFFYSNLSRRGERQAAAGAILYLIAFWLTAVFLSER